MGIRNEILLVGTVANLNRPVKRVDLFLRAGALVLKEFPSVIFVVIGDGPMMKELKCLTVKLGIDKSVIFMGSVSNPLDFIQAFDVAVSSSDSEGFSNAVLEYMACRVPVVATDIGGTREVLKHMVNGILVATGDELRMAKAILYLLRDREKRLSMGILAQAQASNYSIEKMVFRYTDLYRHLLLHQTGRATFDFSCDDPRQRQQQVKKPGFS